MTRIIMQTPRILKSHKRRTQLRELSDPALAHRLFETAWIEIPIFSEASDVVQEAMRRLNPEAYDTPVEYCVEEPD